MEYSTDKPAATLKPEALPPRVADAVLRVSLFAATLVAVVVMVTSKQTEVVPVPGAPVGVMIPHTAKFHHSPPFVYFVAALSVACLYSIITTLASLSLTLKPAFSKKFFLHFAFWDILILGVVASAMGAASAEAYNGLRGNRHVGWSKVCPTYDKFCVHVGTSAAVSLLASFILVFLIMLSFFSLYKQVLH
ncbi:hypothetical protein Patl1_25582 [Pistacia atlantica]|uniref:Uncharacterized protein n=1 Tax=Pistacia atlantica TaxID=434234 RepID=A0ACC1AZT0_9ROSI|nr:hypothetical protein Patl1_25582 [Pistacia atlantica]